MSIACENYGINLSLTFCPLFVRRSTTESCVQTCRPRLARRASAASTCWWRTLLVFITYSHYRISPGQQRGDQFSPLQSHARLSACALCSYLMWENSCRSPLHSLFQSRKQSWWSNSATSDTLRLFWLFVLVCFVIYLSVLIAFTRYAKKTVRVCAVTTFAVKEVLENIWRGLHVNIPFSLVVCVFWLLLTAQKLQFYTSFIHIEAQMTNVWQYFKLNVLIPLLLAQTH
jgi:hypothetical protein